MKELAILHPPGWKSPSGYSHGVSSPMGGGSRVIVTAGQIGWNPVTGQFESDRFVDQAAQALRNVVAIVKAAGAEPDQIVRLTWFVTSRDAYLESTRELGSR